MAYPRLEIDLNKIKHNTESMVYECKNRGVQVVGITKVFCGNERIAQALVDGGVDMLGDSRIQNLKKLSNFKLPKMLLRIPMLSEASEVVKYADISLVSELEVIKELSLHAMKQQMVHNIILMIDLGDLREGIFYEDEIFKAVQEILLLSGINLLGLGTNLSCYGGIIPTNKNLSRLIDIKNKIEEKFNICLEVVSGGNSGSLSLFKDDEIPGGINQLRLGASLSLGIGLNDEPIEGLYTDAFKLIVEIIEVKEKPSIPIGEMGLDAFGNKPVFEDKGIRKRAICAIGKQDINVNDLIYKNEDLIVLGGSSDHLILDITNLEHDYKVGDKIEFDLTYGGCLSTMTSEYVHKAFKIYK